MLFDRQFTDPGVSPYRDVAVRRTRANHDGAHKSIVAPADWPLSTARAIAALADDRFGGAPTADTKPGDIPVFLRDQPRWATDGDSLLALGVLDQIAARWTTWGWRLGYFDQADDAEAFYDDVRWLLVHRAVAPDAISWAGLSGTPRLRGYGVDPFTGKTMPAHLLPDFAPVTASGTEAIGAVGNVVRLIRDTVESRKHQTGQSTLPTPVVTLDLLQFIGHSGALDAAALAAATRLATLIAEIELSTRLARSEADARGIYANRPIAIGPANLGAFVMSQGLPHNSDSGRALAQAATGLITAAAAAMSGEIAVEAGPCPAFTTVKRPLVRAIMIQARAMQSAMERIGAVVRPEHLGSMARTIADVAEPLWAAALKAGGTGLRNSRFTALQSVAGRGPLPISQQSVGAKALPALLCDQQLGNGQLTRMVAPVVTHGLGMLGHDVTVQAAAIRHLRGRRTLDGAPGVSLDALRAKGLNEASLARVEAAMAETNHIRYAFTRWVIGGDVCDDVLGLAPTETQDYGFDMLTALGFSAEEIEAANRYCLGSHNLTGTPGLAGNDARALALPDNADAAFDAETAMVRALNLVLSVPAALPERGSTDARISESEKEANSAAPAHALAAADRS